MSTNSLGVSLLTFRLVSSTDHLTESRTYTQGWHPTLTGARMCMAGPMFNISKKLHLRGNCTSNQNWACLCALSKSSTLFWKIIKASKSKLSEKLNNGWKWVGHWWVLSYCSGVPGRGYLVERWVRGCVAQIGCFFGLSGFPMAPFLFENWFRYRLRFCKMHNFRWIFPLVYL